MAVSSWQLDRIVVRWNVRNGNRPTNQRQRLELEDRRQRLGRVYRASMPEGLDTICCYARESSEVAREAALILDAKEAGKQNSSTGERQRRLMCPSLSVISAQLFKHIGLVHDGES